MNSPWTRLAAGLALLLSMVLLGRGLTLTDDLSALLPAEGELSEALDLVQRFQVADTMLIEVDGTGVSRKELLAATDDLGERLRTEPRFGAVRYRAEVEDGRRLQAAVKPHAVALIPQDQLAERLSDEGLRTALRGQLARLAGPGGSMFEGAFLADPLDVSGLALSQLRGTTGPFAVAVEDGHFLDRTGTRALILVEPTIPALEMGPEHELLDILAAELAATELPTDWLGGHRMASEAAGMIHADVQRAITLGTVLLVLLFLLGFRSLRPVLGSLGSAGMAAAAAAAVAALLSPIHGISMGFAAAVLGLAVDYWIHLYVAASSKPPAPDFRGRYELARQAFDEIRPALLLGAGSTAGACLVLMISRYPVVRDLGAMGIAAALGALLGTWLLGPVLFGVFGGRRLPSLPLGRIPRLARLGLILATLAALVFASNTRFEGDPRELGPARPETRELEQQLAARYGGFGTGGLIAIRGETLDEALGQAWQVQQALEALPGVDPVGPARLLPGATVAQARADALPPVEELQARVEAAAVEVGFTAEAVSGVAERLHATSPVPLSAETWEGTPVSSLASGHVLADDKAVMLSVVLADDSLGEAVEAATRQASPRAELVLTSQFATRGVDAIVSELVRLGSLALVGIVLVLGLRYRDPRKVLAALAPCLVAVAFALGALGLIGEPWNAVSACGMILILGLGLDYGVFMVESSTRAERLGHTGYAVLMSALTTLFGFGVMAITRSPALFGVGLAVLVGVAAAMTSALLVSPRLASGEPLLGGRLGRWGLGLAALALILVNADLLAQQLFYLSPGPSGTAPTWELEQPRPGDRRFGPNRLVQSQGVWTQYTEGDPYSRGWAAAVMAPDLRKRLEDQTLVSFSDSVPNPIGRYLILRGTGLWAPRLDQHFLPEHLAELVGSTDAGDDHFALLGPAYTRKVYYHAIHDIGQAVVDSPFVVGCTGFMAQDADGHWILGRNFDFDGGPIFDRDKVVQFVQPEDGYAFVSVGFTGFLGVVSGMNEQGIAVAINASGSDDPPVAGTPMTLIIREILERAGTLEEAEAILVRRKGFVSENVMVVDAAGDRAALFEVSPRRLDLIEVQGQLGVANHFRTDTFAGDEQTAWRIDEITTRYRQARVDELLAEEPISMERAVEILQDRQGPEGRILPPGHRWAIDADIATHSVVMKPASGEIWVSRYPNTSGGYVAYTLEDALDEGAIEPVEVVPAGDVRRTVDIHRGRKLLKEGGSAPQRESAARRAMLLMPGHPQPMLALGEALVDQGRCEDALPILEEALAVPLEYASQTRSAEELVASCR